MNVKITARQARVLWTYMATKNPGVHPILEMLGATAEEEWKTKADARRVARLLREMAEAIDDYLDHTGPPAKPEEDSETPDF